jgi:hypothetical protein
MYPNSIPGEALQEIFVNKSCLKSILKLNFSSDFFMTIAKKKVKYK